MGDLNDVKTTRHTQITLTKKSREHQPRGVPTSRHQTSFLPLSHDGPHTVAFHSSKSLFT
jgi:hypothetical protein